MATAGMADMARQEGRDNHACHQESAVSEVHRERGRLPHELLQSCWVIHACSFHDPDQHPRAKSLFQGVVA